MTPDQYITKAIHAINTDQPNLAMLYMRRGIQVSKEARREALRGTPPWGPMIAGLDALNDVFVSVAEALAPLSKMFDPLPRKSCPCTTNGAGDMCECNCHVLREASW